MGVTRFRQGNKYRSGQLIREDVKTKSNVNANDSSYEYALAA